MDEPNKTQPLNYTPLKKIKLQSSPHQKIHDAIIGEHLLDEAFMWQKTFLFSILIFVFLFIYQFLLNGNYNKYSINSALASTSMILIGLSFALSGICYFWNFADSKIIYRKHLGVIGFFYAAIHSGISFFLYPKSAPLEYFLSESRRVPFLFGLSALIILLMMAMISNRFSIQKLGGKVWRNLLHLGYLAYVFVILHIIFLNLDSIKTYLPPTFMIILGLGLLVLLLRLVLYWKIKKPSNSTSPM